MLMLFLAYVGVPIAFVYFTWDSLNVLVWGTQAPSICSNYRDKLGDLIHLGGIDDSHGMMHQRRAHAWAVLRWATLWSLLVLGYWHIYDQEEIRLTAALLAARQSQSPHHCGESPVDPTLLENLSYTFWPVSAVQTCAEWNASRTISTWPNPFWVLSELFCSVVTRPIDHIANALGHSIASFLHHFGWFMQTYFLSIPVLCLVIGFVIWPLVQVPRAWLKLGMSAAPAKRYVVPPPAYTTKQCLD